MDTGSEKPFIDQNIERVRTEVDLRLQNERLQLLSDAAADLLAHPDPDQVVQGLFARVAEHLGLDTYFNFMVAGDRLHLDLCAGISEETRRQIEWLDFGQAICGTVAQFRKSIVAEHIQTSSYEKAALVRGLGICAYCCHPLMVGDRLIGTLSFASHTRNTFTPDEVAFLGTLCHYVAMAKERKRAEQAVKESEERFRQLADNIIQLVWIADGSGWIFWYNRRWFEYTGTTLEQMQGWGWKSVHHPEHIERVTEKWRQHLSAGKAWEDTFPLRGADGQYRWFLSRAFPIRNEAGEVVRWFGTNTDVNEQMEFAQERERHLEEVKGLNARLQRAMRETHHRIKNNLQIIAGLIELQMGDGNASVPVEELRRLERHVCALSVIHDLLSKSARTNIDADELSIRAALEQLRQALLPMMKGRRLTVEAEEIHLPARQVVSLAVMVDELILNALKHGGGDMQVSLVKHSSQARLTFTDRGPGFPSNFRQEVANSTGLELLESVAQTDLQGTVSYQNRTEGGAQVVVTFPLETSIVKA